MTTSVTEVKTELLRLEHISKHYAGVTALKDVDLSLMAGEVHALLGENGAGKSTLMGIASGSTPADPGGAILVDGEPKSPYTPAIATTSGVAIVHQHPAVLPDLTVAENLLIAIPRSARGRSGWMQQLLDRVGCSADLKARVESLGVADRQLLELAKALAINPRVLILDEPTAALGADAVDALFDEVRRAAAAGTAVVYITHRLAEVRQIADRVTVLRDGSVQGAALVSDITDEEILRMIVGRTVESVFPPKRSARESASPVLRVEELSGDGFESVSFEVQPGEVMGLAGIVGNGQAEILRALAGLAHASGTAVLAGGPLPLGSSIASRAAGVAYLPADRHAEGLLMRLSVRENASISALKRFARQGVINEAAERATVVGRTPGTQHPNGITGGAGRLPLGRQPAEGRTDPCDADRAGHRPRRRTDPRRRRRGPGRDLPHPEGCRGVRNAGARRLLRRQGAGGSLRSRARHVARPPHRPARRRRSDRGAHDRGHHLGHHAPNGHDAAGAVTRAGRPPPQVGTSLRRR